MMSDSFQIGHLASTRILCWELYLHDHRRGVSAANLCFVQNASSQQCTVSVQVQDLTIFFCFLRRQSLYEILEAIKIIPESAGYRKTVEATVKHR